ncbi:MAG: ABC transporter ATP-binding protein [Pseudomonadota bacterium]
MTAPRLEFRDVSRVFAPRRGAAPTAAVVDVSLAVRDGEIVSLIGPSGCGKSTVLNLGAGLDRPSAGTVLVDGEVVTKPSPHVAIMLQKDLLLPWRTIRENVEFGLEIHGAAAPLRQAPAASLLRQCRLEEFAAHYPHQLSGGMRQRAALARTLAVEPSVLLLDEPFSALDAQTKMLLQQDLARTLKATGKTALFITHDLVEAVSLSDRVLVMSARPGRIIEEIAIELPRRDDPMWRREQPGMAEYVPRLMALLHLREAA